MRAVRATLEADGLGKAFGRNDVLKSASFAAWPGRTTVLMGRNGTGKSTMLRAAVGAVRADYGRIVYKGEFYPRPHLWRLARKGLMYSAQESALTPLFSIERHLTAFGQVYGRNGAIPEILERLNLCEFLNRRPSGISGGEKQRVSLALALIRLPDCLLMDEPFAGVAPRDRSYLVKGFQALREAGCAVVVTGHDVEDLMTVADEVIWVTGGTTHWIGTPDEAIRHGQFRREYLGSRLGASRVRDRTGGSGSIR